MQDLIRLVNEQWNSYGRLTEEAKKADRDPHSIIASFGPTFSSIECITADQRRQHLSAWRQYLNPLSEIASRYSPVDIEQIGQHIDTGLIVNRGGHQYYSVGDIFCEYNKATLAAKTALIVVSGIAHNKVGMTTEEKGALLIDFLRACPHVVQLPIDKRLDSILIGDEAFAPTLDALKTTIVKAMRSQQPNAFPTDITVWEAYPALKVGGKNKSTMECLKAISQFNKYHMLSSYVSEHLSNVPDTGVVSSRVETRETRGERGQAGKGCWEELSTSQESWIPR